mmetsp:Transcript_18696/g.24340  ORF Transcript_18696/g.24340 Transcript_18696/m.24340 type:complete len:289 (+) Transcript_18696:139-1005(+)
MTSNISTLQNHLDMGASQEDQSDINSLEYNKEKSIQLPPVSDLVTPIEHKINEDDGFIQVHRKNNRSPKQNPNAYEIAINQFIEYSGLTSPTSSSSSKPIVIISRGLPGCGKSYLSGRIEKAAKDLHRPCRVCSADKYFEQSGQYIFDPSKLSLAHQFCRNAFHNSLQTPNSVIIIDNTNTTQWEYENYVSEAIDFGARVFIVEIELPIEKKIFYQRYQSGYNVGKGGKGGKGRQQHPSTLPKATMQILQACADRNTHKVPLDAIEKMYRRWEDDSRGFKIPVGGMSV